MFHYIYLYFAKHRQKKRQTKQTKWHTHRAKD